MEIDRSEVGESWSILDSPDRMRCIQWDDVDGVLDTSVRCPLWICVFEAEGRANWSSGIDEGEMCIIGDIRSIARNWYVYHPIRSFLNISKSTFVKAFVKILAR